MEEIYLLLGIVIVLLLAILIGAFLGRRHMSETFLMELHSLRDLTEKRLDRLEPALNRLEPALRDELSKNRLELSQHLRDNRKETQSTLETLRTAVGGELHQFRQSVDELAKSNREEVNKLRSELTSTLHRFSEDVSIQLKNILDTVGNELKSFREVLQKENRDNRTEMSSRLQEFQKTLSDQTEALRRLVDEKVSQLSGEVTSNLDKIRQSNEAEIEKVRQLVSEKLESALQAQLKSSFEQLVHSLAQVHKDVGEMQELVREVGDIKRVLVSVKHRGILGEAQLEALLDNTIPDLYQKQYKLGEGTVDFVIRMPVANKDAGQEVWLPVDAKFPAESLQALQAAYESGDSKQVEEAIKEFRKAIQSRAKEIRKYIDDNDKIRTPGYAIMFLPTEALYAEVVRDQSFFEELYRKYQVVVAGPATIIAFLNSLRMGHRTIIIERRTQEVLRVLGAIRTEFEKFSEVLEDAQKKIQSANMQIDKLVGTRTRQIQRTLKRIEQLPEISQEEAVRLLKAYGEEGQKGE